MKMLSVLIPMSVVLVLTVVVSVIVVFTRSNVIENSLLVNTTVGVIRGLRAGDGSKMFLGIPYSVVDKTNPFGAAIPNPIFEDIFNAFNDSVRCPQFQELPMTSLDCLHLNIHVPKTLHKKLPVFVYIYGGDFMFGTSSRSIYSPKFLIRHDVIFVSFNYRTTAYGFMCLHTPEVPGNQGLKDQLNALRWIKNNIKAFGGDDENITIVGNSAGAVSVDLQLLFADEGLFHKVISLSGTSLDPWVFPEHDPNVAFKLANQLGLQTNNISKAITFLSNHTPSQVVLAAEALKILFRPCVEKKMINVEGFVTDHPVSTPFAKAKNISILYGYNNDELLVPTYFNMSNDAFEKLDIFNKSINFGFDIGPNHETMKWFVRRFYIADEPLSGKLNQAVVDFESDFCFTHPTQRTLVKYLEHGGTAYHYVFSYVGGRNLGRLNYNVTEGGAVHADELGYIFDMARMEDTPSPDDQLMIDRITTLYTNFAKYGDPTPTPTELLPRKWLPITRAKLRYLNITKTLEMRTRPFHHRLSFWDLFYKTNREYIKGYSNKIYWDNI